MKVIPLHSGSCSLSFLLPSSLHPLLLYFRNSIIQMPITYVTFQLPSLHYSEAWRGCMYHPPSYKQLDAHPMLTLTLAKIPSRSCPI